MVYLRIIIVAWRLAWPHVLTPWQSKLLRWRLETYGITDADGQMLSAKEITAGVFLRFCFVRRRELWRFLRWAALLEQQ